MKFHVACALLALFAAAEAGKKLEAMSFGSGYNHMYEKPGDLDVETGDYQGNLGSTSAELVSASTSVSELAKDDLSMRSEAHSNIARSNIDAAENKRAAANEYHKRAQDQSVRANEAYKNSQLHKRQSHDKQTIAKEYDQRAQMHDRLSKEQDINEQDLLRKGNLEYREHMNNQRRANAAATNANMYHEEAEAELAFSSEWESLARDLYSRAEQYEKQVLELREKAKKEKENAKALEAKGKEEEARGQEYEAAFLETSKKVNQLKYYELEFLMKSEHERHQAEDARIRAKYYSLLANMLKDQSDALFRFANYEHSDYQLYNRRSVEYQQQMKVMATSASKMLKDHSYYGGTMYTKGISTYSNYHGAQ